MHLVNNKQQKSRLEIAKVASETSLLSLSLSLSLSLLSFLHSIKQIFTFIPIDAVLCCR